jgi:cytochrome c-type biogenesis protein CcmH
MITFWIVAAVLVVSALGFVLWPLLARQSLPELDQQGANVAIFRRRLAELEAERAAGVLGDAEATEAKLELERQLLGDLAPASAAAAPARASYRSAAAVALALPAAVVALYLHLGSPATLAGSPVADIPQDAEGQLAFIREHLGQLEAKVQSDPDDLEALLMLGRAYVVLQRYDDAVALFQRAEHRAEQQPLLLVDQAEALGYAQGGNLQGRPVALLERALSIEPALPKALWLAGLAAMQAERPQQARQYWQRLLAVLPPDSGTAAQVNELLAQLDGAAPAASGGAAVDVRVRLAPELAERVPADATVFVLARAVDGPKAPLAVVRQPAAQLPLAVRLDESMAMVAGSTLKEFPQVVIEARVSLSGDAASRSGDLIGRSAPVAVAAEAPVEIVIDQVVQ